MDYTINTMFAGKADMLERKWANLDGNEKKNDNRHPR